MFERQIEFINANSLYNAGITENSNPFIALYVNFNDCVLRCGVLVLELFVFCSYNKNVVQHFKGNLLWGSHTALKTLLIFLILVL